MRPETLETNFWFDSSVILSHITHNWYPMAKSLEKDFFLKIKNLPFALTMLTVTNVLYVLLSDAVLQYVSVECSSNICHVNSW